MNTEKFTKGPYRYQNHNRPISNTCYHEVYTDRGEVVDDLIAHASSEANAHLIAAAPDLYEALEDLLYYGQDGSPRHYAMAIDNAKKALAKARGN